MPVRALQSRDSSGVTVPYVKRQMPGRAFLRVNTDVFSGRIIYNTERIMDAGDY